MQFSTADLRGFHALPLKKRREFLALCAMLESHDEPEQRTEYPAEGQGVRSEDTDTGAKISSLRKYQARGGRPPKRKGITVAEAAGIAEPSLQVVDGGIVSPNDQQHKQELPEG